VLTSAADDDARSATLLGADEDAKVEIDAASDEDDDSDAVDPPERDASECLALNSVEV
jgi:hypothetical protein